MSSVFRLLNRKFEEILGAAMLAVMVTVAFINVVVRYCSSFSFAWTEELTVNFFVWIVLLGTSVAFREAGNLRMNLIYDHAPKAVRLILYIFSIVLCISFFAVLAYMGYIEVLDEIDLEVTSEALELPVWWYTCCIPLMSLVIIFRILQKAVLTIHTGFY